MPSTRVGFRGRQSGYIAAIAAHWSPDKKGPNNVNISLSNVLTLSYRRIREQHFPQSVGVGSGGGGGVKYIAVHTLDHRFSQNGKTTLNKF